MPRSLLDTDILSEILKGKNQKITRAAQGYLAQHRRLTVSAITVLELVRGFEKSGAIVQAERFRLTIDGFAIVPVDRPVAELAGQIDGRLLNAGLPIGIADVLIAATALYHGLDLVSGNTAHYEYIRTLGYDLSLANWR